MKKLIALFLCIITLFSMFSIVGYSATVEENEAVPYYNNVSKASHTVSLSSNGTVSIVNKYAGTNGVTTKAVITTYIEKRFLGIFWTRVDIGTTDDEWVDTIYNYTYSGSHSFKLESTGTYRVTTEFVIYGSGGSADTIIDESTIEY